MFSESKTKNISKAIAKLQFWEAGRGEYPGDVTGACQLTWPLASFSPVQIEIDPKPAEQDLFSCLPQEKYSCMRSKWWGCFNMVLSALKMWCLYLYMNAVFINVTQYSVCFLCNGTAMLTHPPPQPTSQPLINLWLVNKSEVEIAQRAVIAA